MNLVVFFFEFSLVVIILTVLITQVILPFMRGTVLFPIFRKETKLTHQLEEVRQKKVEEEIKCEIKKTQNQKVKE